MVNVDDTDCRVADAATELMPEKGRIESAAIKIELA